VAAKRKNKKQRKASQSARKKAAVKKKLVKKKAVPQRKSSRKKARHKKKRIRGTSANVDMAAFELQGMGARSAGQSGDLQGLSGIAGAASESVEELLEEGNAFEADVVKGVEDAGNAEENEVVTHEVPEDDVPKEYLDEK
jgi:hypothetical protein